MRQIILDTETTGFKPEDGNRIIQIAALELSDRRPTLKKLLDIKIHPGQKYMEECYSEISYAGAFRVHGISIEELKGQSSFAEIAPQLIEIFEDSELIIHNAKFDLGFLDHHLKELGFKTTLEYAKSVIDTLAIARSKFTGAKNNLDALCDRFKINRSNRVFHGALIDCELLAEVYINLTREQISLLGDESKIIAKKRKFKKIDTNKLNLVAVKNTIEEIEAHNNYLKILDKISNGTSSWYNKSENHE